MSFTIVGTFSQLGLNRNAAGYEIYGLLQPEQEPLTMQMKVRQVTADIFQQAKDTGEEAGLDSQGQVYFNNALLRTMGVVNDGATMNTLYILIAIVVVIIMIGSVSLIYNAFAISLSERSRYLGMLSSVGATRSQKRGSVFVGGRSHSCGTVGRRSGHRHHLFLHQSYDAGVLRDGSRSSRDHQLCLHGAGRGAFRPDHLYFRLYSRPAGLPHFGH